MNTLTTFISLLGPYPIPLEWISCKHTNYDNIQSFLSLKIHSIKYTYNTKTQRMEEKTSFKFP
jgi:hypothetical protein